MSAHAYTEDQLVEQPAIGLFAELGWTTVSTLDKTFGATGTLLRETKGEVVLVSRLRAALERLNPALPPKAIAAKIQNLCRTRVLLQLRVASPLIAGAPHGLAIQRHHLTAQPRAHALRPARQTIAELLLAAKAWKTRLQVSCLGAPWRRRRKVLSPGKRTAPNASMS